MLFSYMLPLCLFPLDVCIDNACRTFARAHGFDDCGRADYDVATGKYAGHGRGARLYVGDNITPFVELDAGAVSCQQRISLISQSGDYHVAFDFES